ncbi:hypothetical protein BD626DRAFT_522341 [Schizophyllum amplum]|uniref:Integrase core domain-containing protein n=1 Tax=Schizophyllum amplum TaxID=97359 RepID=A0A550BTD7_9AGAR|nr:hypothetical protein BD626DRAFT_522341 [Auriculariopsis ampla]
METNFGVERGSYIWGRSVHNIRIERLWVDVTRGFGIKWYNFFMDLEIHYDLRPDADEDIWLLHTLFLSSIDEDACEWAESWNHHRLTLSDRRAQSPRELFFFGVLQHGLRAPDGTVIAADEVVDDPSTYGVDWEELRDDSLLVHHAEHNPEAGDAAVEIVDAAELDEVDATGAAASRRPAHMASVEVPAFHCPFADPQDLEVFTESVLAMPEYYSRDMGDRRSLWVQARTLMLTLLSGP